MNDVAPPRLGTPVQLGLLIVVICLNTIDRQIVAVLAEPIKHDLALSDTQLGMLTGLFFALFYSAVGVPLAHYADRTDRPRLLSIATAAWSAMTAVCAAATGFVSMALARAGVAIGEAGCNPATQSLIADYYPAEKRGTVQGLLVMSVPISGLAALALGGLVAEAWGWRAAFVVAAVPGLLIAPFVWKLLPEPRRAAPPHARRALGASIRGLISNKALVWLVVAMAATSVQAFAMLLWVPAYFMRSFGWSVAQAGVGLGLGVAVGGVLGSVIAGRLADRLRARQLGGQLLISAAVVALGIPLFVGMLLTGHAAVAVGCFVALQVSGIATNPGVYAALQDLSDDRARALAFALMALVANVVGMGIGPVVLGAVSDALTPAHGAQSLRYALLGCTLTQVLALALMLYAYRRIRAHRPAARVAGAT